MQQRPCGALPVDPSVNPAREWVGAAIDEARVVQRAQSVQIGQHSAEISPEVLEITWKFEESEPTQLPVTQYYRNAVHSGGLFAADAETARACAVPFVEFSMAIEKARRLALGVVGPPPPLPSVPALVAGSQKKLSANLDNGS